MLVITFLSVGGYIWFVHTRLFVCCPISVQSFFQLDFSPALEMSFICISTPVFLVFFFFFLHDRIHEMKHPALR